MDVRYIALISNNIVDTTLDMAHEDISELIEYISHMVYSYDITNLWLDYSNTDSLDMDFGEMNTVKELTASNNYISVLPKEIGKLKRLDFLSLSHNEISVLPDDIGKLVNLTELNVSYNNLTRLPLSIGNLKKLRYLNIKGNNVIEADIERIKKMLPRCKILN